MSLQAVAQRVAAKVYAWELANSRALNRPPVDCYVSALRAQDEAYAAAFKPERPAVHLPWRWIKRDT